jgi:hypothetical protein
MHFCDARLDEKMRLASRIKFRRRKKAHCEQWAGCQRPKNLALGLTLIQRRFSADFAPI